jgi:hypothetical protein
MLGQTLRVHVTLSLLAPVHWQTADLTNNGIALVPVTERAPEYKYIEPIKERLSQRRLFTDIEAVAVGALDFACPSLMNLPVEHVDAPFNSF